MKNIKVLLISLLVLISGNIFAQKCTVQGIVRYEYNDYIGYKTDTGAEVGSVSFSVSGVSLQTS